VLTAPCDDALRQCRPDPRQSRDFAHVGSIQIDVLTRQQWTGELRRSARSFAKRIRAWC
jgi:hypothetical protein